MVKYKIAISNDFYTFDMWYIETVHEQFKRKLCLPMLLRKVTAFGHSKFRPVDLASRSLIFEYIRIRQIECTSLFDYTNSNIQICKLEYSRIDSIFPSLIDIYWVD